MNYINKDVLSKKKQILLSSQVKNDIDLLNFNELIKRRKMYSKLPFSLLDDDIYIDKVYLNNMTDLISYIDTKLITYQEFLNYLNDINLDKVKNEINNYLDDYYALKFYYETLKENINFYQIKDYQEIITYLNNLIEKVSLNRKVLKYTLSNKKKIYISKSSKDELDKLNYDELIDKRKSYASIPFYELNNKINVDKESLIKITNLIGYIDDKLITYQEFLNYLKKINLNYVKENLLVDNNLEYLYTLKFYYKTLKENINIYQIKDYQEIIIYLDSLINKL
ncbi:MAG: hypothetical protein MR266_05070 [Erysipelotrichaceae bacterium]|nr:hypothetical protein [Erysipelotrichaceae bacterium]